MLKECSSELNYEQYRLPWSEGIFPVFWWQLSYPNGKSLQLGPCKEILKESVCHIFCCDEMKLVLNCISQSWNQKQSKLYQGVSLSHQFFALTFSDNCDCPITSQRARYDAEKSTCNSKIKHIRTANGVLNSWHMLWWGVYPLPADVWLHVMVPVGPRVLELPQPLPIQIERVYVPAYKVLSQTFWI